MPAGSCGSGAPTCDVLQLASAGASRSLRRSPTAPPKYETLADTRILLNVHRGDDPYFEWARVVEAVANGCVVATETSVGHRPARGRRAPVDGPARRPRRAGRRAGVRRAAPRRAWPDAAHEVLCTRARPVGASSTRALAEARDLIVAESRRPRPAPCRAAAPAAARRSATHARPCRAADDRRPADAREDGQGPEAGVPRPARLTVRTIERSLAIVRFGDADHVTTLSLARVRRCVAGGVRRRPTVQPGLVTWPRRSTRSSPPRHASDPALELIVVDDHSTDDSLAIAERAARRAPVVAVAARRPCRQRRPAGRSQHRLRPCSRLATCSPSTPTTCCTPTACACWPTTSTPPPRPSSPRTGCSSGSTRPAALGLTSHLPWDVDLLVHGAYIDAMAMFRQRRVERARRLRRHHRRLRLGGLRPVAVGRRTRLAGRPGHPAWSAGTVSSPARCARSATSTWPPTSSLFENGIRGSHGPAERQRRSTPSANCAHGSPSWRRCSRRARRPSSDWVPGWPNCRATRRPLWSSALASRGRAAAAAQHQGHPLQRGAASPVWAHRSVPAWLSRRAQGRDQRRCADQVNDALIAELEQALATAREQQALVRSSLATVIGFLDRETGSVTGLTAT